MQHPERNRGRDLGSELLPPHELHRFHVAAVAADHLVQRTVRSLAQPPLRNARLIGSMT